MVTPIFRYHRDGIIEFHDTERGRQLATIFEGMGHIRFVEEPITIEESFRLYGDIRKQNHQAHICKMHVDSLCMGHNNYIPWINLRPDEVLWAKHFCAQFKNPVVLNPMAGGAVQDPHGGHDGRMLPIKGWQRIVDALYGQYDFIYFTKEDNHLPIKKTHPIFHFTFRQMCAVFKVAQVCLGIENGLHHGAIAAGAHSRCFINLDMKTFFAPNTFYLPQMWWDEPRRVEYYAYSGVDGLIQELSGRPVKLPPPDTDLLMTPQPL